MLRCTVVHGINDAWGIVCAWTVGLRLCMCASDAWSIACDGLVHAGVIVCACVVGVPLRMWCQQCLGHCLWWLLHAEGRCALHARFVRLSHVCVLSNLSMCACVACAFRCSWGMEVRSLAGLCGAEEGGAGVLRRVRQGRICAAAWRLCGRAWSCRCERCLPS